MLLFVSEKKLSYYFCCCVEFWRNVSRSNDELSRRRLLLPTLMMLPRRFEIGFARVDPSGGLLSSVCLLGGLSPSSFRFLSCV